jgi:hypothetical protein
MMDLGPDMCHDLGPPKKCTLYSGQLYQFVFYGLSPYATSAPYTLWPSTHSYAKNSSFSSGY